MGEEKTYETKRENGYHVKRLSSICTEHKKRSFRNLKINRSSSSPLIQHTGLNYQTD